LPNSSAKTRAERWPLVLKLWREGKSVTEIANATGLQVSNVRNNYVHQLQTSADPEAYVAERIATLTPQTQLVPVQADRTDEDRGS